MQALSRARRLPPPLSTLLRPRPSLSPSAAAAAAAELGGASAAPVAEPWPRARSFSFRPLSPFGVTCSDLLPLTASLKQWGDHPMPYPNNGACFSSEANKESGDPTETVEELYQKMLKSVEARTMPPNAWLWSLISKCSSHGDIKLLFQILEKLRIFRLSNLRIHANFNSHLCMRVTETCARVSALDYGLKALWKHNVYGLTPTVGSAHYLLLYAKEHNDAKLMGKIMQVLQKNSLPLQSGTADIVFSICYNTDRWDLISKYAKRFIKAGVKLHRTAFDIWMDFAAKVGDSQSIWKIDSLRAKSVKQHTLTSGFSCAKGFLLERKPESAATAIHLLFQNLPDPKKEKIGDELEKLVSEWSQEVVKRQKKDERKVLSESLKADIPAMINSLLNMGLDVKVNIEELARQEA
uniref:Uncharacterized protein n=1 Tax=Ananas comosus var. bracteatus TaxID=296719 RepID=A0A6V7PC00_ANACO|nr:unnamed protein product [Ananas comosus var. bracteatus]